MAKFIMKHIINRKPQINVNVGNVNESTKNVEEEKNKKEINEKVMTTSEKIEMAQNVLNGTTTKRIKRDKGLIERTESSKTILTEDNKELLKD